jgi:hypothetical protein
MYEHTFIFVAPLTDFSNEELILTSAAGDNYAEDEGYVCCTV